ncbi:hypothetical protein NDU88_005782 [Pleurodeles waltl]|uniref:Endonuclease/exonuclease/phosphatase domain-containing protein n=1 Tax=Pleurodeles waltl TaxID=8319 RepID=A0AAV7NPY3_PLEWA|nr:hypothetical protein NDU88_005782 [Pleurodeles waltl]
MQGHSLTIANIYGPNEHQECFLKDALGRVLEMSDEDIVVGGDFNIVPDSHFDRSLQRYGQTGAFSKGFQEWLVGAGLTDIWHAHHPADRAYSFSGAHQTYAHKDLFLTSPRIIALSTSSEIGVASISDHSLLMLSLALSTYTPCRRHWHLNIRLLTYEDILAEIKATISHFLIINDTPMTNITTFWETFKAVIRGQFIAMAARLNVACHNTRQQLGDDIKALEVAIRQAGSLTASRQLTTPRKQLRALDKDMEEYALLQTKQKFYAGGNRAGLLLAHRLHTQATERRVAELRLPDGTLTCQEELIRHQFERFYPDLYSTEELDPKGMEEYLDSAPLSRR